MSAGSQPVLPATRLAHGLAGCCTAGCDRRPCHRRDEGGGIRAWPGARAWMAAHRRPGACRARRWRCGAQGRVRGRNQGASSAPLLIVYYTMSGAHHLLCRLVHACLRLTRLSRCHLPAPRSQLHRHATSHTMPTRLPCPSAQGPRPQQQQQQQHPARDRRPQRVVGQQQAGRGGSGGGVKRNQQSDKRRHSMRRGGASTSRSGRVQQPDTDGWVTVGSRGGR